MIALYVIRTPYVNRFNPLPEEEKEDVDRVKKAKEDLSGWIKTVLEKDNLNEKKTEVKIEVIESTRPSYSEIQEYAKSNKIDLIIVGSRGRTGFKKLLL